MTALLAIFVGVGMGGAVGYKPDCDPDDVAVIANNDNRWLSFGYVIAAK